jgi:molybdopterin synthase sulfur carrier subunit
VRVAVKLYATLREGRFDAAEREVPTGTTVGQLVGLLGVPQEEATLRFVNGRHAALEDEVHDGDALALFPPIGGG